MSLHVIYVFHRRFRMFLLQNESTYSMSVKRPEFRKTLWLTPLNTHGKSNEMKWQLSNRFPAFAVKFFLSWQKTHSGHILFLESIYFLIQDL